MAHSKRIHENYNERQWYCLIQDEIEYYWITYPKECNDLITKQFFQFVKSNGDPKYSQIEVTSNEEGPDSKRTIIFDKKEINNYKNGEKLIFAQQRSNCGMIIIRNVVFTHGDENNQLLGIQIILPYSQPIQSSQSQPPIIQSKSSQLSQYSIEDLLTAIKQNQPDINIDNKKLLIIIKRKMISVPQLTEAEVCAIYLYTTTDLNYSKFALDYKKAQKNGNFVKYKIWLRLFAIGNAKLK